jgi:bla regulator protein BlaR1
VIGDVGNHLWQSTACVAVAALVAFALRNNGAHVRHAVWLIASLKFLVPFSLLLHLGGALPAWMLPEPAMVRTSGVVTVARDVSVVAERVVQPFTADTVDAVLSSAAVQNPVPVAGVLLAVWAIGFLAVVGLRVRGWRRVRAAVRASAPLPLPGPYPVRSAPGLLEPGVVGLWRPVLLLPAGIDRHLSPPQLRAVLEHEFTHIRRRDNLTSALHMVVEAVCWFHPAVWWVGARLVHERERACDEHVLRVCGEPRAYAESILNVCKLYVESPVACVSGVSGSDLKQRIVVILAGRVGGQLTMVGKLGLTVVAMLILCAPLLAGMVGGAQHSAQPSSTFEVVSIRPCATHDPVAAGRGGGQGAAGNGGAGWLANVAPGYVYWECVTLAQLISQAYADREHPLLNASKHLRAENDFQPTSVKGGPSWVRTDRFTVEARGRLELTSPALAGQATRVLRDLPAATSHALRAALDEKFALKVNRATSQQDIYALTIAPSGLDRTRVTTPVAGDCRMRDAYFAALDQSKPPTGANPKICGNVFSGRNVLEFNSYTLESLATYLSTVTDYVVVDQTGVKGLFNFVVSTDGQPGDSRDSRLARGLQTLGLTIERTKAPVEHLLIEHVRR